MPDLPKCPKFQRSQGCPRSDLKLQGETETAWGFQCRTCGVQWVVSKPRERNRARYTNALQAKAEATRGDRAHDARPRYHLIGS